MATVGGSGRKNGRRKRAGGQSQVAPRGCRWRLERVAWVGNGGGERRRIRLDGLRECDEKGGRKSACEMQKE